MPDRLDHHSLTCKQCFSVRKLKCIRQKSIQVTHPCDNLKLIVFQHVAAYFLLFFHWIPTRRSSFLFCASSIMHLYILAGFSHCPSPTQWNWTQNWDSLLKAVSIELSRGNRSSPLTCRQQPLTQNTINILSCKNTLLIQGQHSALQGSQAIFCKAVFQLFCSQHVLVHGVVPPRCKT